MKRPGVEVRARRGYLAPSLAEVTRAAPKAPSTAAPSADMAIATAAAAAVSKLPGAVRDQPFRVHVTAGWRPGADGRPEAAFWTVGEVADRIPGSDLEAVLMTGGGEIVASVRGRIAPGTASLLVPVVATRSPSSRATTRSACGARPPAASRPCRCRSRCRPRRPASGAVFVRRGPQTGNKDAPTADLRFRRSERLRVEVPSATRATGARLLDRTGKPTPVPVASATRNDADGSRWATAELALAPLAPGDYVIEVMADPTRTLVAFRLFRTSANRFPSHEVTSVVQTFSDVLSFVFADERPSIPLRYDYCAPPRSKFSVHGLSGCLSVPRISPESSMRTVRKPLERLREFQLQHPARRRCTAS